MNTPQNVVENLNFLTNAYYDSKSDYWYIFVNFPILTPLEKERIITEKKLWKEPFNPVREFDEEGIKGTITIERQDSLTLVYNPPEETED